MAGFTFTATSGDGRFHIGRKPSVLSLGKRIFVETIHLPKGNEMELYYCLMNYDTAIAHCL